MKISNSIELKTTSDYLLPVFYNSYDKVWIQSLLEVYKRNVGRSYQFNNLILSQKQFYGASYKKQKLMQSILDKQFFKSKKFKAIKPSQIRQFCFRESAKTKISLKTRKFAIERASKHFKIPKHAIEHFMYYDLKSARISIQPSEMDDIENLLLKANLLMVQALLLSSEKVNIFISESSRPIIRYAKWKGLICHLLQNKVNGITEIEISGPLSILQKTSIYGKELGGLVPYLAAMNEFSLSAWIQYGKQVKILKLSKADPIFPKQNLKPFDSKLEENFYKKFLKSTDDWDLKREPGPFQAGHSLVFPDFALTHRTNKNLVWYLEIVGFWTQQYLDEKLVKYKQANINNLILCLKESHKCEIRDLLEKAKVVRFKSSIQPNKILEIINV
ncbi:MAG: DUF790 family protein [Bdellovibrionota bacterium]